MRVPECFRLPIRRAASTRDETRQRPICDYVYDLQLYPVPGRGFEALCRCALDSREATTEETPFLCEMELCVIKAPAVTFVSGFTPSTPPRAGSRSRGRRGAAAAVEGLRA